MNNVDEQLRSMIAPSRAIRRRAAESAASALAPASSAALPSSRDLLGGRRGRFLYAVTKTETENVYVYTTTTSITFKCTPAVSVLPECE